MGRRVDVAECGATENLLAVGTANASGTGCGSVSVRETAARRVPQLRTGESDDGENDERGGGTDLARTGRLLAA